MNINNKSESLNENNHITTSSDFMIQYPNHKWIKNKEEISKWISKNLTCSFSKEKPIEGKDFTINNDLSVNLLNEEFYIYKTAKGKLPIKIKTAKNLTSNDDSLISLIGTPDKAKLLDFTGCMIDNLEGLSGVFNTIDLSGNNLVDFKNMSNKLTVKKFNLLGNPIKSWDGFGLKSKVNIIHWSYEIDEFQKSLLLEIPKNIKNIELANNLYLKPNFDTLGYLVDSNGYTLNVNALKSESKTQKRKNNKVS